MRPHDHKELSGARVELAQVWQLAKTRNDTDEQHHMLRREQERRCAESIRDAFLAVVLRGAARTETCYSEGLAGDSDGSGNVLENRKKS